MSIPHVIHQTWKTANNLPEYYRPEWQQSWKDNHPSWQYRFWTDSDLRKLAADKYPEHLPVFDSPNRWPGVVRGDLGRLMVLDQFGGVYADLDYVSLRPLEPLVDVAGRTFIGAVLPSYMQLFVPQAFVASAPGHPILRDVLANGVSWVKRDVPNVIRGYGFSAFSGTFRLHERDAGVYKAPPEELCPLSWMPQHYEEVHNNRRLSVADLRTAYPRAYAITFWETGWGSRRRKRFDQDEQVPEFPPHKPALVQEPDLRLTAVPKRKWPKWAKSIGRFRSDKDKGVGDTAARLLGERGEWFKRQFKKWTGKDCGCDRRHDEWNALYPYGPKISEG
jgi:hypothetical protein